MFDLYKNICHIFSKNLVFHVKINFYVQIMNLCIIFIMYTLKIQLFFIPFQNLYILGDFHLKVLLFIYQ